MTSEGPFVEIICPSENASVLIRRGGGMLERVDLTDNMLSAEKERRTLALSRPW
jgi:hypothetical protein